MRITEIYDYVKIDGSDRVEYAYHHSDGRVFSCVARCLAEARNLRNDWLVGRGIFS